MSWRETGRETTGHRTFTIYRCGWCRKLAVTIGEGAPPTSRCCCVEAAKRAPAATRSDPSGWWP